jgi:3-oxoadipate enol-lactonase
MAMLAIDVGDARFNVGIDGPAGAPVLLFSNSLGTSLEMWTQQCQALTKSFRIVRYDSRGHGVTSVTPGPYTIELLARDALAILDALAIARAHVCGLSMGGMVGMWLAINAAERVDRLVLSNTAPQIFSAERWNARIASVNSGGVASIADAVLEGWLTARFRERDPATLARMRAMLTATPDAGYVASCAAVRDADQWNAIAGISRPTLVIAGTHDMATTAAIGRRMAQSIAGAQYVELDAAHISNVEAAAGFTAALTDFLA